MTVSDPGMTFRADLRALLDLIPSGLPPEDYQITLVGMCIDRVALAEQAIGRNPRLLHRATAKFQARDVDGALALVRRWTTKELH